MSLTLTHQQKQDRPAQCPDHVGCNFDKIKIILKYCLQCEVYWHQLVTVTNSAVSVYLSSKVPTKVPTVQNSYSFMAWRAYISFVLVPVTSNGRAKDPGWQYITGLWRNAKLSILLSYLLTIKLQVQVQYAFIILSLFPPPLSLLIFRQMTIKWVAKSNSCNVVML